MRCWERAYFVTGTGFTGYYFIFPLYYTSLLKNQNIFLRNKMTVHLAELQPFCGIIHSPVAIHISLVVPRHVCSSWFLQTRMQFGIKLGTQWLFLLAFLMFRTVPCYDTDMLKSPLNVSPSGFIGFFPVGLVSLFL